MYKKIAVLLQEDKVQTIVLLAILNVSTQWIMYGPIYVENNFSTPYHLHAVYVIESILSPRKSNVWFVMMVLPDPLREIRLNMQLWTNYVLVKMWMIQS